MRLRIKTRRSKKNERQAVRGKDALRRGAHALHGAVAEALARELGAAGRPRRGLADWRLGRAEEEP